MSDQDLPSPYGPGPFDTFPERERLDARVVRTTGERVEIHGYDVADDLSRHYSFAEIVLTSLIGEAPTAQVGRLFELCCQMAAPVSVAEAPAHAGRIAETIGTNAAGTVAAVATGLSEQVRFQLERLASFREWLDAPDGAPPECAYADDESLEGLADAFHSRVCQLDVDLPGMDANFSFWAMLVAALHACGLRNERLITAALVTARLPTAAAEGVRGKTGRLSDYPMNMPPLDYLHHEARDE